MIREYIENQINDITVEQEDGCIMTYSRRINLKVDWKGIKTRMDFAVWAVFVLAGLRYMQAVSEWDEEVVYILTYCPYDDESKDYLAEYEGSSEQQEIAKRYIDEAIEVLFRSGKEKSKMAKKKVTTKRSKKKPCPGSGIRSGGRGKNLGRGKGKGPIGKPSKAK